MGVAHSDDRGAQSKKLTEHWPRQLHYVHFYMSQLEGTTFCFQFWHETLFFRSFCLFSPLILSHLFPRFSHNLYSLNSKYTLPVLLFLQSCMLDLSNWKATQNSNSNSMCPNSSSLSPNLLLLTFQFLSSSHLGLKPQSCPRLGCSILINSRLWSNSVQQCPSPDLSSYGHYLYSGPHHLHIITNMMIIIPNTGLVLCVRY